MRLLILAVVAFVIYTLLRQLLRGWTKKELPPRSSRSGTMVRCALCGLHIPDQEAVRRGQQILLQQQSLKGIPALRAGAPPVTGAPRPRR